MNKKNIKKNKNENQEREFWSNFDLSKNFEKNDFQPVVFPNLKPTTQSISIRMPKFLLNQLKERANELSIPYQSLIKSYLQKQLSLKK